MSRSAYSAHLDLVAADRYAALEACQLILPVAHLADLEMMARYALVVAGGDPTRAERRSVLGWDTTCDRPAESRPDRCSRPRRLRQAERSSPQPLSGFRDVEVGPVQVRDRPVHQVLEEHPRSSSPWTARAGSQFRRSMTSVSDAPGMIRVASPAISASRRCTSSHPHAYVSRVSTEAPRYLRLVRAYRSGPTASCSPVAGASSAHPAGLRLRARPCRRRRGRGQPLPRSRSSSPPNSGPPVPRRRTRFPSLLPKWSPAQHRRAPGGEPVAFAALSPLRAKPEAPARCRARVPDGGNRLPVPRAPPGMRSKTWRIDCHGLPRTLSVLWVSPASSRASRDSSHSESRAAATRSSLPSTGSVSSSLHASTGPGPYARRRPEVSSPSVPRRDR